MPLTSGERKSVTWKPAGAPARAAGAKYFARMAACGQISTHLLHWMHSAMSQTGISSARLRFSQREVPVGQVPSGGNALTGRSSPRPESMTAVMLRTKSGASSGTGSGRRRVEVAPAAGSGTSWRDSSARSTAAVLLRTTSSPCRP